MAKIVLSGGPHGGEIVDVVVKPGESFEFETGRYRRDVSDMELAVYTGPSSSAPAPVFGSRVSAALRARE